MYVKENLFMFRIIYKSKSNYICIRFTLKPSPGKNQHKVAVNKED